MKRSPEAKEILFNEEAHRVALGRGAGSQQNATKLHGPKGRNVVAG